jgi:hypothetical protein
MGLKSRNMFVSLIAIVLVMAPAQQFAVAGPSPVIDPNAPSSPLRCRSSSG